MAAGVAVRERPAIALATRVRDVHQDHPPDGSRTTSGADTGVARDCGGLARGTPHRPVGTHARTLPRSVWPGPEPQATGARSTRGLPSSRTGLPGRLRPLP